MVECGFAAYLDTKKAGKQIVIHKADCVDHKSHEGHAREWFYNISYDSIRFVVEQIAAHQDVDVHNCKHCMPDQ